MNEFDPVKLEKEIRMGMNLVDRNEFNATIRAVSHIAATTVQKTLGPYARTTIIDMAILLIPPKMVGVSCKDFGSKIPPIRASSPC